MFRNIKSDKPKLVLKPLTLDAAEQFHAWRNDPDILYYTSDEPIKETIEQSKTKLKNLIGSVTTKYLGIYHREKLIGFVIIAKLSEINRNCMLGIVIGDKAERRKGFGYEAMRIALKYCFIDLKMHRVGAEVYDFNIAAVKLMEKCGFILEGNNREYVYKKNVYCSQLIFSLLKREWEMLPQETFSTRTEPHCKQVTRQPSSPTLQIPSMSASNTSSRPTQQPIKRNFSTDIKHVPITATWASQTKIVTNGLFDSRILKVSATSHEDVSRHNFNTASASIRLPANCRCRLPASPYFSNHSARWLTFRSKPLLIPKTAAGALSLITAVAAFTFKKTS